MKEKGDFLQAVPGKGILFLLSFLLMSCPGCDEGNPVRVADEEYVEHLERTVDGAGISSLDASTTNGFIGVRGTAGTEVVVQITKEVRAPTEEEAEEFARKVEIFVERDGDQIRIYEEHPKLPRNIQVEVDYDIQCPAQMDLRLGTTNGGIDVLATEGDVQAVTTNGNVDVRATRGPFNLRTTNGNIDAEVEALEGEGDFSTTNGNVNVEVGSGTAPLTATTTNGSIEVELPADFSGTLDASTANGRVRSDFHPTAGGGSPQTRITGPLGEDGDTPVQLRTTNGNISVEKR